MRDSDDMRRVNPMWDVDPVRDVDDTRDVNFLDMPGLPEALAAEARQARHPLETLDQDAVLARAAMLRLRRRLGIVAISAVVAVAGASGTLLVAAGGDTGTHPTTADTGTPAPPEWVPPSPQPEFSEPVAAAALAATKVGEGKFPDIFTSVRIDMAERTTIVYLTDLSRRNEFLVQMHSGYPQSYASVLRFKQGAYNQMTCRAEQDRLTAKVPDLPFAVLGVQAAEDCSYIELVVADVAVARDRAAHSPNGAISDGQIPVRLTDRASGETG